jgi:hypothetical protein
VYVGKNSSQAASVEIARPTGSNLSPAQRVRLEEEKQRNGRGPARTRGRGIWSLLRRYARSRLQSFSVKRGRRPLLTVRDNSWNA